MRHCSTRLVFTVWWRGGGTAKNFSRSQTEQCFFVDPQVDSKTASHGVVCDHQKVPKGKQEYEDARKMACTGWNSIED